MLYALTSLLRSQPPALLHGYVCGSSIPAGGKYHRGNIIVVISDCHAAAGRRTEEAGRARETHGRWYKTFGPPSSPSTSSPANWQTVCGCRSSQQPPSSSLAPQVTLPEGNFTLSFLCESFSLSFCLSWSWSFLSRSRWKRWRRQCSSRSCWRWRRSARLLREKYVSKIFGSHRVWFRHSDPRAASDVVALALNYVGSECHSRQLSHFLRIILRVPWRIRDC